MSSLDTILDDLVNIGFVTIDETRRAEGSTVPRITPSFKLFRQCFDLSLSSLSFKCHQKKYGIGKRLKETTRALDYARVPHEYRQDAEWCLWELSQTFESGCLLSSLALCGRILEMCLRYRLDEADISYADDFPIGALLKRLFENDAAPDLSPSLKNVCNIINAYRITAVHKKEHADRYPRIDVVASIILWIVHVFESTFL